MFSGRQKKLSVWWRSPEIQEKLDTSTRKSKLYNKLSEEMANAGFTRTPGQIINNRARYHQVPRDTILS